MQIMRDEYEQALFNKTILTIRRFLDANNACVSFSGGKDSTVLLHLIRTYVDKNIKGVFLNTGIEYPNIVEFVKKQENIDLVRPKKSFFEIISKYGLPIISKEQSQYLSEINNPKISDKIKKQRLSGKNFSISKKWIYILDENIKVSNKCCYHLKKAPLKKYGKDNNIRYFTGERIQESNLRKQRYHTCILPDKCIPLRLWTDEMIEYYINYHKLEICDIYKIERRTGCMFCMYGYHMEKIDNNKFTRMKKHFPEFYELGCKMFDLENVLKIIDKSRKNK